MECFCLCHYDIFQTSISSCIYIYIIYYIRIYYTRIDFIKYYFIVILETGTIIFHTYSFMECFCTCLYNNTMA